MEAIHGVEQRIESRKHCLCDPGLGLAFLAVALDFAEMDGRQWLPVDASRVPLVPQLVIASQVIAEHEKAEPHFRKEWQNETWQ